MKNITIKIDPYTFVITEKEFMALIAKDWDLFTRALERGGQEPEIDLGKLETVQNIMELQELL